MRCGLFLRLFNNAAFGFPNSTRRLLFSRDNRFQLDLACLRHSGNRNECVLRTHVRGYRLTCLRRLKRQLQIVTRLMYGAIRIIHIPTGNQLDIACWAEQHPDYLCSTPTKRASGFALSRRCCKVAVKRHSIRPKANSN